MYINVCVCVCVCVCECACVCVYIYTHCMYQSNLEVNTIFKPYLPPSHGDTIFGKMTQGSNLVSFACRFVGLFNVRITPHQKLLRACFLPLDPSFV